MTFPPVLTRMIVGCYIRQAAWKPGVQDDLYLRARIVEAATGRPLWSLAKNLKSFLTEGPKAFPDIHPLWFSPKDLGMASKFYEKIEQALAKYGITEIDAPDIYQELMTGMSSARSKDALGDLGERYRDKVLDGSRPGQLSGALSMYPWRYTLDRIKRVWTKRKHMPEGIVVTPKSDPRDPGLEHLSPMQAIALIMSGPKGRDFLRWAYKLVKAQGSESMLAVFDVYSKDPDAPNRQLAEALEAATGKSISPQMAGRHRDNALKMIKDEIVKNPRVLDWVQDALEALGLDSTDAVEMAKLPLKWKGRRAGRWDAYTQALDEELSTGATMPKMPDCLTRLAAAIIAKRTLKLSYSGWKPGVEDDIYFRARILESANGMSKWSLSGNPRNFLREGPEMFPDVDPEWFARKSLGLADAAYYSIEKVLHDRGDTSLSTEDVYQDTVTAFGQQREDLPGAIGTKYRANIFEKGWGPRSFKKGINNIAFRRALDVVKKNRTKTKALGGPVNIGPGGDDDTPDIDPADVVNTLSPMRAIALIMSGPKGRDFLRWAFKIVEAKGSEPQKAVFNAYVDDPSATNAQLAEGLGISPQMAGRHRDNALKMIKDEIVKNPRVLDWVQDALALQGLDDIDAVEMAKLPLKWKGRRASMATRVAWRWVRLAGYSPLERWFDQADPRGDLSDTLSDAIIAWAEKTVSDRKALEWEVIPSDEEAVTESGVSLTSKDVEQIKTRFLKEVMRDRRLAAMFDPSEFEIMWKKSLRETWESIWETLQEHYEEALQDNMSTLWKAVRDADEDISFHEDNLRFSERKSGSTWDLFGVMVITINEVDDHPVWTREDARYDELEQRGMDRKRGLL